LYKLDLLTELPGSCGANRWYWNWQRKYLCLSGRRKKSNKVSNSKLQEKTNYQEKLKIIKILLKYW